MNFVRFWIDKLDGCFRFGGVVRDGYIGGIGEVGVIFGVYL